MLRHILVATGFSCGAGNALAYAASLAEIHGAEITLFNLAPVPGIGAPPARYLSQLEAEERQLVGTSAPANLSENRTDQPSPPDGKSE
jgi:hypothetical protein